LVLQPHLVAELLPELLPRLYGETAVHKELVKIVEMGPFKHTVDDGLDARISAYECMCVAVLAETEPAVVSLLTISGRFTLLNTCPGRLNLNDFITRVIGGLGDHHDIKMLTFLIIIRLCRDFADSTALRTYYNCCSSEKRPIVLFFFFLFNIGLDDLATALITVVTAKVCLFFLSFCGGSTADV
jgi:hypothetical protein